MFTGIIEQLGVVESLERSAGGGRIRVRAPKLMASLEISGSIAVNGCCLTIVERNAEAFIADLSPETLRRTTFDEMKSGLKVNLERPLTAGKELGGHLVQGHVDAVGRVVRLIPVSVERTTAEDGNWLLEVQVPADIRQYVAEKGSLTVDGISLTVASWREGVAGFAIIPYTYSHTNLRGFAAGAGVNLEADVLAKYIERLLDARGKS
ncbi:MAG TPA: riboflavin synthase [Candidatus Limnocylindrales bacterium]|nr:riboflavin synthase [Candidatus Limnocylindrales bacterium]